MVPNKIIVHHSLTKDSNTVSWPVIRNYHKRSGYVDIGYHFGVENLRGATEILIGRMPHEVGAHCRGNNYNSLGVLCVGNFDNEAPSKAKWNALKKLISYLMKCFQIEMIYGHGELDARKTCPGKMFDMDRLRLELGVKL